MIVKNFSNDKYSSPPFRQAAFKYKGAPWAVGEKTLQDAIVLHGKTGSPVALKTELPISRWLSRQNVLSPAFKTLLYSLIQRTKHLAQRQAIQMGSTREKRMPSRRQNKLPNARVWNAITVMYRALVRPCLLTLLCRHKTPSQSRRRCATLAPRLAPRQSRSMSHCRSSYPPPRTAPLRSLPALATTRFSLASTHLWTTLASFCACGGAYEVGIRGDMNCIIHVLIFYFLVKEVFSK